MSDDTGSKPQPCRFYQQAYPEVEECVVVQVERVDDVSAAVRLLEYNDIEGMILLSELSRRRIRSITKHIRVGNVEVLRVTRVDEEKGYVDLSKKRVNAAEAAEKNEYYQKSKSVHSLMFHVAQMTKFSMLKLYEMFCWDLYTRYGHARDAFSLAVRGNLVPKAKKVLMVLTSHAATDGGAATGWYLPECAHPYFKFIKAGFEVEFASIKGGATTVALDSLDMKDAENKAFWENEELKALTQNTKALSEFNGKDFDSVFFVGGFGTMWDFPLSEDVDRVGRECYERGGILGAVCHGPICFANIKDSNDNLIIAGKNCTGFTEEEEAFCGLKDQLPMHEGKGQSCEEVLAALGGTYSKTDAWGSHVVTDGRVVTGQNPASAGATGAAVVAAISKMLSLDEFAVLGRYNLDQAILDVLMKEVRRKLTPPPVKIIGQMNLTCYKEAGIEAIQAAVRAALAVAPDNGVKIILKSPPTFDMSTTALDKKEGIALLHACIDAAKTCIETYQGVCKIPSEGEPRSITVEEERKLELMSEQLEGDISD